MGGLLRSFWYWMQMWFGVYNVKAFGAKGDGVTDDASAIQAAINAIPTGQGGYILHFPPGIYLLSSTLILQASQRITIRGSGIGGSNATIIKTTNVNLDMIDASTNLLDTFSLLSLQLQGPGAGTGTGRGLLLGRSAQSAFDSRIENCWFTGIPDSEIYAENMQGYHITLNGFENADYGINIVSGSDNVIENNRFYSLKKAGVNVGGSGNTNNTIIGNHFDICGTSGDSTTGAITFSNSNGTEHRNNLIAGNNFDKNQYDIVLAGTGSLTNHTGTNNTTVTGNTSDFAQGQSIIVNGANGTKILGNTINDANQNNVSVPAIDVQGASDSTVVDGNVTTAAATYYQTYGLQLSATSTNTQLGTNFFKAATGDQNIIAGATLIDENWKSYVPTLYGVNTAGANTYSLQSGYWRQVGREITVYVNLTLATKDASMAGAVRVSLPVTAGSEQSYGTVDVSSVENVTFTSGDFIKGVVPSGADYIRMLVNASGTGAALLDSTAISATTSLIMKASYLV